MKEVERRVSIRIAQCEEDLSGITGFGNGRGHEPKESGRLRAEKGEGNGFFSRTSRRNTALQTP